MDTKERKPIIAALLSLFCSGLGQVYNGQIKKGIILYLTTILPLALFLTRLRYHYYGLIIIITIVILFHLLIIIEAIVTSIKLKEITLNKYNKWYFYVAFYILVCFTTNAIFLNDYAEKGVLSLKAYNYPSDSMNPSIVINDKFFVDFNYYKANIPQKGDVVVFNFPLEPKRQYVRRVIAIEGDLIETKNDNIYVNDVAITDLYNIQGQKVFSDKNLKEIVPPEKVYVLGDNVNISNDSRVYGYIDINNIKGKVLYIYSSNEKGRVGLDVK